MPYIHKMLIVCCLGFGIFANTLWAETNEYTKKTARLKTLEGKISEAKKTIQELIEEKNHTTDGSKQNAKVEEIKAVHKEFVKDSAEFNKLHQEVEYKYPEKGADLREKFALKKEQSIEEIERETTLDDRLSEVKKEMDKKYAPITGWKPKTKAEAIKDMPEEEKPAEKRKLKLVK